MSRSLLIKVLLFLLLFFPEQSRGFINIESLRQNFQEGFYGSSGLQVSGSSGNVSVFNSGVNSQNIYKEKRREYLLITNYTYGEASGEKITNNGNAHIRYAQKFRPNWQWEVFGQVEFNEFQDLALRTLGGGGLRLRLFDDQRTSLYLGGGTFYEDEDINHSPDQANFRGNLYLSFRKILDNEVETVLVVYYQPSYNTIADYRIRTTAGLEMELTKMLRLINSFRFAYDSRPPANILREDISYSIGFNFSY